MWETWHSRQTRMQAYPLYNTGILNSLGFSILKKKQGRKWLLQDLYNCGAQPIMLIIIKLSLCNCVLTRRTQRGSLFACLFYKRGLYHSSPFPDGEVEAWRSEILQKWLGKQSKPSSPQGLISLHYTILCFHTVKGDVPKEHLQPSISSSYGLNTDKEQVLFVA